MKRLPGFYEIAKLYIKAPMGIILLQLVLAPVQPNLYLSCLPTVSSWCLNISMIQPEKACSWKTAIAIPRLVNAKSCLAVIGKFVLNLPTYYARLPLRGRCQTVLPGWSILHTNSSASYISIWKSTSHQPFRSFLLLKIFVTSHNGITKFIKVFEYMESICRQPGLGRPSKIKRSRWVANGQAGINWR